MRLFFNRWISAKLGLATVVTSLVLAGAAPGALIRIDFQADIYDTDEDNGEARIGDTMVGTLIYDSATPVDSGAPGNYPGAVTLIDLGIIPNSGPNTGLYFSQIFDNANADIFVGVDSFELNYFVNISSGNFGLQLRQGPTFSQDLDTATNAMLAANPNVLDIFTDAFNNSEAILQTDYTFGEAYATFNFVEVTLVPEPGSAALLVLGIGVLAGRRRRA